MATAITSCSVLFLCSSRPNIVRLFVNTVNTLICYIVILLYHIVNYFAGYHAHIVVYT